MDEQKFKNTVAENIAHYRKAAGLTQGALAAKINYTDKSVSKWERGDGLPDVFVLSEMADIFGITVNELISCEKSESTAKSVKKISVKKKIIPLLSAGIVWLAASVIFVVLEIVFDSFFTNVKIREWLAFIYAIPISFIVLTVFACIWHGMAARCIAVSGIIWGVFTSVILSVPLKKIYLTVIIAAIIQVMTVLWFFMRHRSRLQKAKDKESAVNSAEKLENKNSGG